MLDVKNVRLNDGIVLNVMNDYIGKQIEKSKNYYEYEILSNFIDYFPTNAVVYDIGANIGNHTVFFSKYLKAKKVYSFEPSEEVYNLLKGNIERNYLKGVETYNYAIGERNSLGNITIDESNLGASTMNEDEQGNVEIKPLDSFEKDAPDFVKIDVEGFELKVLLGMKNILTKHKPVLWIEIFDDHFKQVDDFLKEYNYVLIDRWLDNHVYVSVDENSYQDLFELIKNKAFRRFNSEINRLTLLMRDKNSVITTLQKKIADISNNSKDVKNEKVNDLLLDKLNQVLEREHHTLNRFDEMLDKYFKQVNFLEGNNDKSEYRSQQEILSNISFISREEELIQKIEEQILESKRIETENTLLKSELLNANREKEQLNNKYNALKNSKLGKLTLKYWSYRNK